MYALQKSPKLTLISRFLVETDGFKNERPRRLTLISDTEWSLVIYQMEDKATSPVAYPNCGGTASPIK